MEFGEACKGFFYPTCSNGVRYKEVRMADFDQTSVLAAGVDASEFDFPAGRRGKAIGSPPFFPFVFLRSIHTVALPVLRNDTAHH
jgi:hypothetical protein